MKISIKEDVVYEVLKYPQCSTLFQYKLPRGVIRALSNRMFYKNCKSHLIILQNTPS